MRLLDEIDVLSHQVAKSDSDGSDRSTVTANISQQHPGDPSRRARRQVINVSAANAVPERLAVDPQIKTGN
jgi:hypothetical protein